MLANPYTLTACAIALVVAVYAIRMVVTHLVESRRERLEQERLDGYLRDVREAQDEEFERHERMREEAAAATSGFGRRA